MNFFFKLLCSYIKYKIIGTFQLDHIGLEVFILKLSLVLVRVCPKFKARKIPLTSAKVAGLPES